METEDNFTAVVNDNEVINDKSTEVNKDRSKNEDPVVFTNLADAKEVNVGTVEESSTGVTVVAENIESEVDKDDQKQEDLSSTVQEVVQSDIKTADATEEDQKLESGTEEQLLETEETKQSPDVTGESDEKEAENTMEHTSSGDGIAKVQLEESAEVDLILLLFLI